MNQNVPAKGAGKRNKNKNTSPSQLAQAKAQVLREIRRTVPKKGAMKNNRLPSLSKENFQDFPRGVGQFNSGPAYQTNKKGEPFSEDEYIGEVNGSVSFASIGYYINPGQAATFPWLSKKALLYEKYRFKQLEFYYKPEVTQYSTNGVGKIVLSTDYDAADPLPSSKQQALDTQPHSDGMPYETVVLRLDPREMQDWRYVRPGALPGGTDIKTYDLGQLAVSVQGQGSGSAIGELRVRYSGEFAVPVLENTTSAPTNFRVSQFNSTSPESLTTTVAQTLLLATATFNGISATNASGVITLPVGNYVITAEAQITSASGTTASRLDLLVNGSVSTLSIQNSVTAGTPSSTMVGTWFVQSTGSTTVAIRVTDTFAGSSTANGQLVIVSV